MIGSNSIVIDASALVAIYKQESDALRYWECLNESGALVLPGSAYLECVMVLRRHSGSRLWLDDLIASTGITLFGSDARQAHLAADAFERYGRGSSHRARLNFGDCLVYAAAKALAAPLLFKGDDFRGTDVAAALD